MTLEHDRLVTASSDREDEALDRAIRPRVLDEYVGQEAVKQQLEAADAPWTPGRLPEWEPE